MRGSERLRAVDRSVVPMADVLPGLPMAESVAVRLIRITVASMGQFFEPVFRHMGLPESSFHVLCLLVATERGQASPSELSDLVGTSRANMTRILDALVEDGSASRAAEVRDGRRQIIQITAAGRRAVIEAMPKLAQPLEQAFSGLTTGELAQLGTLLRKVIRSFDQIAVIEAPRRAIRRAR